MGLFSGKESRAAAARQAARTVRASTGWNHLLNLLRQQEGLRVLDIGPTSSTNINFLTGLGHSVYMANLIGEASDAKWAREPDVPFPVDDYLSENLQMGGREFDVILFWDTADYLPGDLSQAVVGRLHQMLVPGGSLLAFFHIKAETESHRYHLLGDGQLEAQTTGKDETRHLMNNRQIEHLFRDYGSYRFFLAKDNLREVLVIR